MYQLTVLNFNSIRSLISFGIVCLIGLDTKTTLNLRHENKFGYIGKYYIHVKIDGQRLRVSVIGKCFCRLHEFLCDLKTVSANAPVLSIRLI